MAENLVNAHVTGNPSETGENGTPLTVTGYSGQQVPLQVWESEVDTNNGGVHFQIAEDGYPELDVISSAPANDPASGKVKLFVKDVDGKLQLAVKNSSGSEFPLQASSAKVVMQPPLGSLASGVSFETDVTLDASTIYIVPFPVEAGYRVEVTDLTGAWSDGTGLRGIGIGYGPPDFLSASITLGDLVRWLFPDGSLYFLNSPGASEAGHDNDPYPDGRHGELIVGYVNGSTFQFQSVSDFPQFTLGLGVNDSLLMFQMNDTPITDNIGAVQFHLKISNGWSSGTFDQTVASVATPFNTDPDTTYTITIQGWVEHNPFNHDHVHDAVYASENHWATSHVIAAGIGVYLDGQTIYDGTSTPTPAYSDDHVYQFTRIGTGNPFAFQAEGGTPQAQVGGPGFVVTVVG